MTNIYDGMQIEKGGRTFRVNLPYDDTNRAPWEESDGHGPVRKVNTAHCHREGVKRPGERPMNRPDRNEYQYFYDWQEAAKMARVDGWNAAPFDAPNRIERAVLADFNFLSGWINGDWQYVGVVVELLDEEGETVDGYSASLWGVESNSDEFILTVANELADEIISQLDEEAKQEKIKNRFVDAMNCGL